MAYSHSSASGSSSSSSSSTGTVTVAQVMATNPLPTLRLTRPPNVQAMEIRQTFQTLHQSLMTLERDLSSSWHAAFTEDDEKEMHKPSSKRTAKNIEKARKMLDKMRNDINGTLERSVRRSLDSMDRMSPEAQAALVEFWAEMKEFIVAFAEWIERLISNIIDRLLAGQRLERKVFAKTFDSAMAILMSTLNGAHQSQQQHHHQPAAPHHHQQPHMY